MIPVFRPSVSAAEIEAVTRVLESGWWGSGPEVAKFEDEFAAYIGVKYAVALNSCTAALHLAGALMDLPAGSEIITSPITFISSAYIADYNDCKIVFADVDPETMNLDPEDVERKITPDTKAIMAIHYGGRSCDMATLRCIADEHDLFLIEDCAHATGASYGGDMLGSLGDISCFSFQAVKNLAVGDGGMLLTNNEAWYERVKALRWVGISRDTNSRTKAIYKWEYEISEVGYKYQMTDISAAIGRVQFQRLLELNGRRKEITDRYNEAFSQKDLIETPPTIGEPSYHNYCIKLPSEEVRNGLMQHLSDNGIGSSVHYKPLYLHKVYSHIKADCPIADDIWKRILLLPVFPDLTEEDLTKVIEAVLAYE